MSKVKKSGVPHYELLYIISNKFSENELAPINEKIEKLITDKGGVITYKDVWGKKKLAYQINGFAYGYYQLLEFDLSGEKAQALSNDLRLSNELLRHMVVARPLRTVEEIEAEKKRQISMMQKTKEERQRPEAPIAVVKEQPSPEKKEKKEEKKVDLEQLDEKLDKILETNDLI